MSEKFYVGLDLTGSENNGKFNPISRVTLLVDDENFYTAGDDTGMVLSANCAHATQDMADAILAQVKGYQYQAYSADDANIDPAAELGDGVTADGMYSVISRIKDDGSGYSGLSAPGEAELDEEYPTSGPMTQEINQKFAATRSIIKKTAEEIRLEVETELENLSSSFSVQLDSITAKVTGLDGAYTELKTTVGGVTVTDSSGTTRIKGNSIETDTLYVNAANITGTLTADQIKLSGSIGWDELDSSVQNDIEDAYNMAADAEYSFASITYSYNGKTYLDESMLRTESVIASNLMGGTVSLLDVYEDICGTLSLSPASSGDYAVDLASYAALRLEAWDGDIFMQNSTGQYLHLSTVSESVVAGQGNLTSNMDGVYSCGESGRMWSDVYAVNATIQTSDLTKKHDVVYDLSEFDGFFDRLKPMSFIFNEGTSGRRHHGLGAQDVESLLLDCGFTSMDFAGFIKSPKTDESGKKIEGDYNYALRYGEFIPMLIDQVQRLKNRVSSLEGYIS